MKCAARNPDCHLQRPSPRGTFLVIPAAHPGRACASHRRRPFCNLSARRASQTGCLQGQPSTSRFRIHQSECPGQRGRAQIQEKLRPSPPSRPRLLQREGACVPRVCALVRWHSCSETQQRPQETDLGELRWFGLPSQAFSVAKVERILLP